MERKQETEHIIAFLDLLGASEIIMDKNDDKKSEDVLNSISELFTSAEKLFTAPSEKIPELQNLKCATFSDNIVFALDLSVIPSDKIESAIWEFIIIIAFFQNMALGRDLLFRGGISLGPLYMNPKENFLWGKALVDAHYLEEKVAIYPRVVLSRQFEKKKFNLSPALICMDFDGIYFVNYMPTTLKLFPQKVEKATDLIEKEYDRASPAGEANEWGRERILQKYAWLQRYIDRSKTI